MSLNMYKICRKCSPTLFFLLFFQFAQAQKDYSGIDTWMERSQKSLGGKAALAIYKEGAIAFQKEMGDMTVKMPVALGQLTQLPTVVMIASLVDAGLLEWDEPLGNHIPVLSKYFKNYITAFHGLSHTTGVERNHGDAHKIAERKKAINLEEAINQLVTLETSNNTGKEFYFGTIGPYFPARAAEVVTKRSYERLMQERITRPVKMRFTKFDHELGYAPNPSNGARGAVIDYISFLSVFLNEGKFEDKEIVSPDALKKILSVSTNGMTIKSKPGYAKNWEYCLGLWKIEDGLYAIAGENGNWAILNTRKKYAAVLLVENSQKTALEEVFRSLLNELEQLF